MAKVAIWMGHSGSETGASGLLVEDDVTRAARTWAVAYAKARGVAVLTDNDDMSLRQRINASNATTLAGILEFHGNSGGGHGIEGWYSQGSPTTGKKLATATIAPAPQFGLPIRGAYNSATNRLGWLGILDDTKAPALLIELIYLDNIADVAVWRASGKAYVEAITGAWLDALGIGGGNAVAVAPAPPSKSATATPAKPSAPASLAGSASPPAGGAGKPLALTGVWDENLTERLQMLYGIIPDRVISGQYPWSNFAGVVRGFEFVRNNPPGSQTIYAMQVASGLPHPDGLLGPQTLKFWQQLAGTPADGIISPNSQFVIWLQRQVNAGRRPF